MVSAVLASLMNSYLGQYLELTDSVISVGSEVRLSNVKLKESALSDLGLPVKCVHGKVSKLVIKIPWFSLFTSPTSIEVDGLHLLVVPSTSVKYDEEKEKQLNHEAKLKRLQRAEDAKAIRETKSLLNDGTKGKEEATKDSFLERLGANILKNLEVIITRVHIRYEDDGRSTGGYPFATGITLEKLTINTKADDSTSDKLNVFKKFVMLDSLALYWRPRANLYSVETIDRDEVVDVMFNSNIGTREKPIGKLKYLLGPISSNARLEWCLNPEYYSFEKPQMDLFISMEELKLSLTKYQYYDFVLLLQSFEFMSRASQFRKYKARYDLENLPHYRGRSKDLWNFAYDSVFEEKVMRRRRNWSWTHISQHTQNCKAYREAYKLKLSKGTSNLKKSTLHDLDKYEHILDEVNIRIQRQLAMNEVEEVVEEKKSKESSGGWFSGWFGGSQRKEEDHSKGTSIQLMNKDMRKLGQALSNEEKFKLYEVLDYQDDAQYGIYPKSYVARKLNFFLDRLTVTICDEDLNDAAVVTLELSTVQSSLTQRPSANNFKVLMDLQKLTIVGFNGVPLANTALKDSGLLHFEFENNPPAGDDLEKASLYDQRLTLTSSTLEFIYDSASLYHLMEVFKTSEELNLANLQHTAASYLHEYRQTSTLTLQYIVDNRNLVDINICFNSCIVILPMDGKYTTDSPLAVANLGSMIIKSQPVTNNLKQLSNKSSFNLSELTESLRSQVYYKFDVSLENMQVLVSLGEHENWRNEISAADSPLFLLNPTSIHLKLEICVIKNDPELPLYKISGNLKSISVTIADYRLIKLTQIIDTIIDAYKNAASFSSLRRADSNESMVSALSSFANSGSLMSSFTSAPVNTAPDIVNVKVSDTKVPSVNMTDLLLDFSIQSVYLKISHLKPHSSRKEEEDIFYFMINDLDASAKVQRFATRGLFHVGGISCEHLLLRTPSNEPVKIIQTETDPQAGGSNRLFSLTYVDANKASPDFANEYASTLKSMNAVFDCVHIMVHQDALLDLVAKLNKLIDELSSKASNIMSATPSTEPEGPNTTALKPKRDPSPVHANPRLTNQLSLKTTASIGLWALKAKKRSNSMDQGCEITELEVNAVFKSVSFDFMTSKIHLARMRVKNLESSYIQRESDKIITARLVDFTVSDGSSHTIYPHIIRSMDKKVFDAKIRLFNNISSEMKARDPTLIDLQVSVQMGRIRLVFLMKFLNDFLAFLEPFSTAKEIVAEKANDALEEASKTFSNAYANAIRAQLDIKMEAPLIIIPVFSRSKTALSANLGTLSLHNRFKQDPQRQDIVYDEMFVQLKDLNLLRVKFRDEDNKIISSTPIVKPITFELDLLRNMAGVTKISDPPELSIQGTLYSIEAEMSKGDYNVIMAVLSDNFTEKGSFATLSKNNNNNSALAPVREGSLRKNPKGPLSLPLRKKNSAASKGSLSSSLGSFKSIQRLISSEDKHPEACAVNFDFKFLGFQAEIFSNETTFQEPRARSEALAKIHLEHLCVNGSLKVNSSLVANVGIKDCILEDSRDFEEIVCGKRIVKLMEAKKVENNSSQRSTNMIDVLYSRDPLGNSDIQVTIHSFILVGSISYLLDIAYFFIPPDDSSGYEWSSSATKTARDDEPSKEVSANDEEPTKINFFLLMEEPDIFLVENICDVYSESLLLNMELQFKYTSTSDGAMSIVSSLTNIRCHTRPFRSGRTDDSVAQILQPCTVSFSASQPLSHGMRVNANFSDVCLHVSPRSIRIIQNSVSAFLESMNTQTATNTTTSASYGELTALSLSQESSDLEDLWATLPYKEDQFWFLKPEERDFVEATEDLIYSEGGRTPLSTHFNRDEQAIINVNNLIIKIGTDSSVVPSVLIESSLEVDVKNWSSERMSAIGTIKLEVAYYNSKCALWEPVLEPIVQRSLTESSPSYKRWDLNVTLQNNAPNDFGSALISPSFDDVDSFVSPEHMPPLSSVSFVSREVLEITITKSFLKVVNDLSAEFLSGPPEEEKQRRALTQLKSNSGLLVVQNRLGKDIEIQLKSKGFLYSLVASEEEEDSSISASSIFLLPHNQDVTLDFKRTDKHDKVGKDIYVSPLREQKETSDATLRLHVEGERQRAFEVPFSKADQRFFPFQFRGNEAGLNVNMGLVSSIKVEHGCKFVTLGSLVRFKNGYRLPVEIFISPSEKSKSLKKMCVLSTDKTFHVPAGDLTSHSTYFGFRVSEVGGNIGVQFLSWKELLGSGSLSKVIRCTNCNGEPDVFISLECSSDQVYFEQSQRLNGVVYNVDIKPVLIFKNCLPFTLHYRVGNSEESSYIERGTIAHFRGLKYGETGVQFQIFEFREMDWSCSQVLQESMEELSLWKFESVGDKKQKLDLGVHSILHGGTRVISIYAPFWMINKTGKNLMYKGNNDAAGLIHHPVEWGDTPLMFSYSARSLFGKSQCSVRLENSSWSNPFTLDTIEDAGKVTCKSTHQRRGDPQSQSHIGININLSKSSLTKIISFTPYYMLMNLAKDFAVELAEYDDKGVPKWIRLEPDECVPFWPNLHEDVILRIAGTEEVTRAFTLNTVHSTLLSLNNRYGGLHAECRISSSETLLTISQYKKGFAPVRLINHSQVNMIQYWESGERGMKYLGPGETCLFTWNHPNGPRKLLWSVSGFSEEYINTLECDGQGVLELSKGSHLEWVSFLNGMQRILLFSQDAGLCYQLARNLGEMERIDQEIDVSIQGIGISFVHNEDSTAGFVNKELLYASISASDIVWEYRKSGKTRYKPLTQRQCLELERDFQIYMRERSIGHSVSHTRSIGSDLRVNYQEEKILSPFEGRLRRQFQRGLWFQTRLSAHQRQYHAKINRFQIDNQLRECLFPVVFAPVPLPKSVMSESIPKPFMELSILEFLSSEHSELRQYKYFQSLVQECHIKIDQGMINALMDFFFEAGEENLDVQEFLDEDLKLAKKGLKDFATLTVTQGHKDFYDYLHLSPLKVHVSFSLTSYNSTGAPRSNFIGLILQSFGVTITDTDDIIFRLAYFERRHTFFSSEDLLGEMIRHYKSQAIKQIYVLIFGLDVIGNPLGLVVGVTRSVEDLFYEPFQGAVEGPSEFAEGLGIGVRSVFSGVVGGAAGTVSRITGALGKGLASLTFDEKFQNKRRDAIKRRGRQNFGTSMARSSKGLIMGLVDGVTGVATKPIVGAMEDGVLGFFKGAAMGTIGVVARPVGGVIDFTSGAFDSVKRATEVSQEIGRMRPARFLHPDGVVRYYDLKSAQWTKVLSDLNKGHFTKTDYYVSYESNPFEKDTGYLVTNKRILSIVYKTVMGTWSINWEFLTRDLFGPPTLGMEEGEKWYLLLKTKEEAGSRSLGLLGSIFSSGDKGKKMYIRSREIARNLARLIENLRVISANELTE